MNPPPTTVSCKNQLHHREADFAKTTNSHLRQASMFSRRSNLLFISARDYLCDFFATNTFFPPLPALRFLIRLPFLHFATWRPLSFLALHREVANPEAIVTAGGRARLKKWALAWRSAGRQQSVALLWRDLIRAGNLGEWMQTGLVLHIELSFFSEDFAFSR